MTSFKGFLKKYYIVLIILVGCLIRVIGLGVIPGGVNQDEAYAGYEAYSILHYGKDSFGYHNPVYFTTWGSGMNVLNSYLMIPFIALFGLKTWVIRMPQVIVSCCSLPVFYLYLKRMFNKKTAIIGLIILCICPWHILLSRFGLESNLAPGFLLFAQYFFIKSIDKSKNLIISAVFYGLSLYCYSAIWPIVPIMIIASVIYLMYVKKFKFDANVIISTIILIIFAVPLILFLLINKGFINEISNNIISIPKLVYMRSDDISLSHLFTNYHNFNKMMVQQNDGLYWNATSEFGLYYHGMLLVAIIGLLCDVKDVYVSFKSKKREVNLKMINIIAFLSALILAGMISVNINRINCIHIPILIFMASGVANIIECFKSKIKHISHIAIIFALIAFTSFTCFYFGEYADNIGNIFDDGFEDALTYAQNVSDGDKISICDVTYSKVMFYSKIPVDEFISTVKYSNYPSPFLSAKEFGKFKFEIEQIGYENVYILRKESVPQELTDYDIKYIKGFAVLKRKY